MRELIEILDISGYVIVADALNCQKKTAKAIISGGGDYLLNVKDNHETLKKDIEDYVQDVDLRQSMDSATTLEKNSGRIERRTAYATNDIEWLMEINFRSFYVESIDNCLQIMYVLLQS